jgi:activator of 2-hydroxyglutaryl-CoA dehydratase
MLKMPMNLQLFAEGGEGGNGDQNTENQQQQQTGQQQSQQTGGIDYDKIQSMLDTATAKKENAVLKSYFQQQGLSEEEVSQAIASFKATKQQQNQQQQQDNSAMQTEIAQATALAEKAQIELEATKVAMTLGIDATSLTYVLKMADLSNVKDKDGKISQDNVKAAINKVLEDVPALKPKKEDNKGFQIGGSGQGQQQQNTTVNTPTKRWNRFN